MNSPTLPTLPWQVLPITPLPEVFVDDTPMAWGLWDAAVRALDDKASAAGEQGAAA